MRVPWCFPYRKDSRPSQGHPGCRWGTPGWRRSTRVGTRSRIPLLLTRSDPSLIGLATLAARAERPRPRPRPPFFSAQRSADRGEIGRSIPANPRFGLFWACVSRSVRRCRLFTCFLGSRTDLAPVEGDFCTGGDLTPLGSGPDTQTQKAGQSKRTLSIGSKPYREGGRIQSPDENSWLSSYHC